MLRHWQSECINLALNKYLQGKQHFLTQATPGAGKTFMAASLSKKMFDENLIDFVICFSPSKSISDSIQRSFSHVLSCTFDGKIGTMGCSMTYQSLRHLSPKFWATLSRYRVLCVFDEIHHCSGDSETNANSWGSSILTDIQSAAKYTLALTGTPWRSNFTPVVLASYSDPAGEIICDYQYLLSHAVADKVCRQPKIVLIDSLKSVVSTPNSTNNYNSLNDLINKSKINYSMVLNNDDAIFHLLENAVHRLNFIRSQNKNAGGVIVASSIEHAKYLQEILSRNFKQSTTLVTYKEPNAQVLIDEFRQSDTEWIVSIGMVSEGTDIPRLQVCCHLSNIKTELYFRQILGRILRITIDENQEAWLYTFAEPTLCQFSEDIEKDIPESCMHVKINELAEFKSTLVEKDEHTDVANVTNTAPLSSECTLSWEDEKNISLHRSIKKIH